MLKYLDINLCFRYNVLMDDKLPLNNVTLHSGGVYNLVLMRDPSTKVI